MTYKRDNNDPDKTKTVHSPEEVKRMLMGGGDPAADRPQSLSERPSGDDKLLAAIEAEQYARRMVRAVKSQDTRPRCPTCGRAFDCACGDECEFCVGGMPVQVLTDPKECPYNERPASR